MDTYFFHQTAVSVAIAPSACNITDQTKPTSNIVTKDVEGVEEVIDMEKQKIHPGYYLYINRRIPSVLRHKVCFEGGHPEWPWTLRGVTQSGHGH